MRVSVALNADGGDYVEYVRATSNAIKHWQLLSIELHGVYARRGPLTTSRGRRIVGNLLL
jgi:hypothetical protein